MIRRRRRAACCCGSMPYRRSKCSSACSRSKRSWRAGCRGRRHMRRRWFGVAAVLILSFGVLGFVGSRIYQEAPPVPDRVVTSDGRVVFDSGSVERGQDVWRGLGGMELGSIWGHGAYVAPDWTADWLHRELVFMQPLVGDLQAEYRRKTYDAQARTITVSPERALAIEANISYYTNLFANGRADYALPKGAIADPARSRALSAYFFWSAWAAATDRPGDHVSYTSNWPHEELVGNKPTPDTLVWTGVSIIVLLAGIGALGFWHAARRREEGPAELPKTDPMLGAAPTPSQRATVKFFWVVCLLFILQIVVGVITAHYGVEGNAFYGIPLAKILPYSVSRTWHVQLGIFWIATAWLAAGLALAPSVGAETRGEGLLVNVLLGVLRARGSAADVPRLRRVGELAPHARDAVDALLSLADLLLHRRRVLEPRRCWPVRLHDQPPDRAVLHAGPQHDAGARPHRAVRRVRNARHGPRAVHGEVAQARPRVAGSAAQSRILVDQPRPRRDGRDQRAARRAAADVCRCRARLLVRAQRRVSAFRCDAHAALAARRRRYDLRGRRRRVRRERARADYAAVGSTGSAR